MAGRGALCALLLAFVVSCGAQRNVIRISLCEQLAESASLSSSDVIEVNGDNSRCSEQTNGFVAYRVILSSNDSSEANPLVMTLQQLSNSELQTVSLPFQGERFGTARFSSVNHVVCPDLGGTVVPTNETLLLVIDIFSTSRLGVDYILEVEPIPMFEISFGQTLDITVGPATTQLRYFQTTERERGRIIEVNAASINDSCAILSIQRARCPVILDELTNVVEFRSMFQTMNQSATISFSNEEMGDQYFILLERVEDALCDPDIDTEPSGTFPDDADFLKVVTTTLSTKRAVRDFGGAIVLPLIWFLAVFVGVTPCAILCSPMWKPTKWCMTRYPKCTKFWDPIFTVIFNMTIFECMRAAWRRCCRLCGRTANFDVNDREASPSTTSGDIIKCSRCQNKVDPFLCHTYTQPYSILRKRYQVYFWTVIAVFVFYILPAFQVLLAVVDAVLNTGDQDLCYYNFKCSHPVTLGSFLRDYKSFNSIWSNILLILFGLLFIFIVWLRDKRYVKLKLTKKSRASDMEAGQGGFQLDDSVPRDRARATQGVGVNGSAPGDSEQETRGVGVNGSAPGDPEQGKRGVGFSGSAPGGPEHDLDNQPGLAHNGSGPRDQETTDVRARQKGPVLNRVDTDYRMCRGEEKITTGIPHLPGLFYALGFALMGEGFLSLVYHICPTNRNFQFDTSFMFIIGGLVMIKLFQLRHPNRNKNAHVAFVLFSFVVFVTLLGIYLDGRSVAVRVVLMLTLLFIFMTFLISLYHHHEIWSRKFWKKMLKGAECLGFRDVRRFWRLMIAFIFNFILVIIFIAARAADIDGLGFASVVLFLFIINAGYFTAVYGFTKMCYRERTLKLLPLVYVIVGVVCMGVALIYFQMNVYDSNMSPSASRELNEGCILVDFYDNHDIWHFFAGCGLFFLFMFLLTIDDGVIDVPHEKIHVF